MADLPRSTRTGRGELAGPAPVPRQVRRVTVQIEQVSSGVLQIGCPDFGWRGGHARNARELAQLVASAFTEAQVAAYSRFRGREYDLASDPKEESPTTATSQPLPTKRRRPARPGSRPDVHDPRGWRIDADGKWVDPGLGRRWRPESRQVQRVQDRREELGLSRIPDQVDPPGRGRGMLGGRSAG